MNLVNGVHFNFKDTKKFKNNIITVDFVEPLKTNNLEKRVLVAEMMENYSKKYNSKLKLARKLAMLYGARFGTNVFKVGQKVVLRIEISFVNENYIDGKVKLTEQIAAFLHEIIFNPYLENGIYPEKLFQLHQNNLRNYIDNLNDDKRYYAGKKLRELYFADDASQAKMIFGNPQKLANLTAKEVTNYYYNMIKVNDVYISAVGDLTPPQIQTIKNEFKFSKRNSKTIDTIRRNKSKKMRSEIENITQEQSILNMAYDMPVSIKDENYAAVLVMNALLGGSPQSLLFANVREKQSLAYYIASSYNSTLCYVTIQSGIDGSKTEQVKKSIANEIQNIINGEYSDELLSQIKLALVSNYLVKSDHERNSVNDLLINNLTNIQKSQNERIEQIKAVQKDDIAKVVKLLDLKAVFLLKGEGNG